jgi:hypothetical protein
VDRSGGRPERDLARSGVAFAGRLAMGPLTHIPAASLLRDPSFTLEAWHDPIEVSTPHLHAYRELGDGHSRALTELFECL